MLTLSDIREKNTESVDYYSCGKKIVESHEHNEQIMSQVFSHRMKSEEQQYSQHQMDPLTHNNASTGALCLNPEYPWSHQNGHFQIFSLFPLQSGPCGSGMMKGDSQPGHTAFCNSCRCGARGRPRLQRRPTPTAGSGGGG